MEWANPMACELWGAASVEQLRDRDFSSDMSEATRSRLHAYLDAFRRDETVEEQWTFYPSGKPVTVRCQCRGIMLPRGVMGMLCEANPSFHDPGALRGIEALRHTTVMITMFDASGETILLENPAAIRVYDHSGRGTPHPFMARFVDAPFAASALTDVQSGQTVQYDAPVHTVDGVRWHAIDIRPTIDPVTGKIAILLNEADVTFAKHVEGELRESQALLERRVENRTAELRLSDRLASVGTLAAGVGHELSNPLAFVRTNLEVLRMELQDAMHTALDASTITAWQTLIDEAIGGTERMTTIISDLRSYARSESKPGPLKPLSELLDASIRLASTEIRHRARLIREYQPMSEQVDERLEQVLVNLLANAAQAIEAGHADENIIRLRCELKDHECRLEVEDTGQGIKDDIRRRVFDPFFTTKPLGQGSGLGLFICQRIIHELGGTIDLYPRTPDRGTLARVRLPRTAKRTRGPTPGEAPTPTWPTPLAATILLVDDEPVLLRALSQVLRGHNIFTAKSGREALDHIRRDQHFDLILCDLMMPEVTGMRFAQLLGKERPDLQDALYFMTGGAFTDRARAFVDEVGDRCLQKPITWAQLRELVTARLATRSTPQTSLARDERSIQS